MGTESQGFLIEIGQGNAASVDHASDTFDTAGDCVSWDGPGGSATVIDSSNLQSVAKEKLMGLPDEGSFTVGFNRDFSDAGQNAMRTARAARQLKNIRCTYSDGTIGIFKAFVLGFSTSGSVDALVAASATLEISGAYTET